MADTIRIEVCPNAAAAARRKLVLEGDELGFQVDVVEASNMTIRGDVNDDGSRVDESILNSGAHWIVLARIPRDNGN